MNADENNCVCGFQLLECHYCGDLRCPNCDPDRGFEVSELNIFAIMEAVASVSLSHDEGCRCLTCRAALDEPGAMAEMLAALAAVPPREGDER